MIITTNTIFLLFDLWSFLKIECALATYLRNNPMYDKLCGWSSLRYIEKKKQNNEENEKIREKKKEKRERERESEDEKEKKGEISQLLLSKLW